MLERLVFSGICIEVREMHINACRYSAFDLRSIVLKALIKMSQWIFTDQQVYDAIFMTANALPAQHRRFLPVLCRHFAESEMALGNHVCPIECGYYDAQYHYMYSG